MALQKIEAPVRGDDSADKSYAYGGKSIGDRQSDVDRLLVDQNEPEEQRFLGTEVAFPDALRFKGAAPEVANSRYIGRSSSCAFTSVHSLLDKIIRCSHGCMTMCSQTNLCVCV